MLTLVCLFCACSEVIFIISHTNAIRITEDNRGIVNVAAYHSHHSVTSSCCPLIPNPVLLWPPIMYQQQGLLAYNPHSISSIYTAGAGPKSSPPSVNLFTLRKYLKMSHQHLYSASIAVVQDEVSIPDVPNKCG